MQTVFEYYEIENTVDDRNSSITGRYITLEAAITALADKSDWYCSKGTGTVYRVVFLLNDDGNTLSKTKDICYRGTGVQNIKTTLGGNSFNMF